MYYVVDQGPGKVLFRGTLEECEAFKAALPADIRIWCKVL